jgi:hypothetical protein
VSTVSSGTWSISNASAFVSSGGVVIGSAPGTDTVYYSVTNVCGTARSSFIITVNTLPDAGLISGPDSVCLYQVIKLVESVPGGVWDELTAHTIVSSTGSVAGFVLGIDTVVYALSNECGRSVAQKLVRVVECSNVGVQELSQETALSVFPNPNKGTFTVKGTVGLSSEEKAGIEVVNMLGQTIYKSDVLKLNGELDQQVVLSDVANGMYLLKVICGNEQKIFHIMIGQ